MKRLFFFIRYFWKNLRRASLKKMHFLIGFGIFLSVATLLITLSAMNGFDRVYQEGILKFHPHVTLPPEDLNPLPLTAFETILNHNEKLKSSVQSVAPYLYREGLLARQGVIKGVILKGLSLPKPFFKGGIVLGEVLAEKLGVPKTKRDFKPILQHLNFAPLEEESFVKLFVHRGEEVSSKNMVSLKVLGVFKSGLYELDSEFALISLDELQNLFQLRENVYGLEIALKNPRDAKEFVNILNAEFADTRTIRSWEEDHQALFDALQMEKWMFRILIGFMIVVSILNLVGTILLAIFQKKHVIAILRALGLSKREVRGLFAFEGIFLGGLGLVLGCGVASIFILILKRFQWIAIDPQVYFLDKLPFSFSLWDSGILFILCLGWIVFVSWWSAKQAITISIREGLHEP